MPIRPKCAMLLVEGVCIPCEFEHKHGITVLRNPTEDEIVAAIKGYEQKVEQTGRKCIKCKQTLQAGYRGYVCSGCTNWQIVSPLKGGCWFCNSVESFPENPLDFSCEFDCNVHRKCVDDVLAVEPEHLEAVLMKQEFTDDVSGSEQVQEGNS